MRTGKSAAGMLVTLYAQATVATLIVLWLFWRLGVESVYGYPAPFYGSLSPSFSLFAVPAASGIVWLVGLFVWMRRGGLPARSRFAMSGLLGLLVGVTALSFMTYAQEAGARATLSVAWSEWRFHLLCGFVFAVYFSALVRFWPRLGETAVRRQTVWILVALVTFSVLFPLSLAMTRDGVDGITRAWDRPTFEYIGDIGKASSIRAFFGKYNEIHPYLTMHSKVHPPGPVVILWVMSFFCGQGALALSIATVMFGALGVIPLYFWARDLGGPRAALVTASLYAVMPSIVVFSAVSGDILFMPITLATLLFFQRAIDSGSARSAVVAGVGYALMTLCSFSLVVIGAYFALVGLWKLGDPARRMHVFKTAALMVVSLLLVHGAVRLWSGYDVIANFELARMQFELDQSHLDEIGPRYAPWVYRLLNPLCWFVFAGIPVSVLCVRALISRGEGIPVRMAVVFGLMLAAIDLLYLARGEGERSAMYIMPFIVLPAGLHLSRICVSRRTSAPFMVTLVAVALQTWAIETWLDTLW